jgi:phospholipase C
VQAGGTLFDIFGADVKANKLPQVSWIVAPEAYCEHGNWPSNYGAWYTSQMLDALTANPEVWSKTAFFLMYDENDGFFDHMVPPTPPASRAQGISTVDITNEIFPGDSSYGAGPYGLGMRVPMVVISPWSKGGYVNSEVFDHTSLIRFIEARFGAQYPGIIESNITTWRRAVTGDLTSAFDFRHPNAKIVTLPNTASYAPTDFTRQPSYVPVPPTNQALPVQEPGVRPARALPYRIEAKGKADAAGNVTIDFVNMGNVTTVFQVRSGNTQTGPWTYTVGPKTDVSDSWSLAGGQTAYDLSVYGPNGFLRAFKGNSAQGAANLRIDSMYSEEGGLVLFIRNAGSVSATVSLLNVYTGHTSTHDLKAGATLNHQADLEDTFGWYDLVVTVASDSSFQQHFAGHVETGRDSITDPAIAGGTISGHDR